MFKRLYFIIRQRLYVFSKRNKPCQGKVYMFHNVNDESDTYSISKDHFNEFLTCLLKNRKIVDIETLLAEKDPDNVVITFDDVYRSVYDNAYPLLKEYDIPYYLFVCNEYLDKDGYLSREQLKEMQDNSRTIIASHFYRHVLSRFLDIDEFKDGVLQGKKELEEISGKEIKQFAFPYGSIYACSKENIDLVAEIFDQVFMTYRLPYNEEYGKIIPRININDETYKEEMR